MALFDETRFRFAFDSAPRLAPTKPKMPTGLSKKSDGDVPQDHATKFPGSFGNPNCFSKNPKGCKGHKTGEFAEPGSQYAAKGGTNAAAAKKVAPKPKAAGGKPPKGKKTYGVKSGIDKIQQAIDAEQNPAKKKAMQQYYDKFVAREKIKQLIAEQKAKEAAAQKPKETAQQPATANGASAAGDAPKAAEKPIPAQDDHEGWKNLYAEIRDENKARLDADFKAGKISKEQWADGHAKEDEKYTSKAAKRDSLIQAAAKAKAEAAAAAQQQADGSAAKDASAKPKVEVKFVGQTSEEHKAEIDAQTEKLNKALADAGIKSSVSEVRTNPFDTQFVFAHDGALSHKELSDLRAKFGSADLKPKLIAADLYSLTIPHAKVADVHFKDVTSEQGVADSVSKMSAPCVFGRGRNGQSVVRDIADMHHLLIGGKTGEGKSSVLNSILVGAMKFKSPEDLEIYTIDPQKVEFDAYADMPHVTRSASGSESGDIEQTVDMLDDCLAEMKHRTELFAKLENGGVKNLKDYRAYRAAHPELGLPNIKTRLVAIDEYPMLVNDPAHGAAIAAKVKSLANLARKAGIHLIIAAQDPKLTSVGDIKGQMTKIALKTANSQASRNILGVNGAETLTGKGDMFIQGAGDNTALERAKGAFINSKQDENGNSDLKTELDGITAKWGKKEPPKPPEAPKPQTGGEAATEEAAPATGGEPQKPATPAPGMSGKTSSEYLYPNTNHPVDISHLGFFSAMAEALKQGWKGNKVTYDPQAYKRMGAEKWQKHLDSLNGTGKQPDYSQHFLSQTLPVPETMSEVQSGQFKKWCAAYNDALSSNDPAAESRVASQYRAWYKQNGFDDLAGIGKSSTVPNPYQKWIDKMNKAGGAKEGKD